MPVTLTFHAGILHDRLGLDSINTVVEEERLGDGGGRPANHQEQHPPSCGPPAPMGQWACCWAWASSKAKGSHHHHHVHSPGPEGFGSLNLAVEAPFNLRHCQHLLDKQLPESMSRAKGMLWFLEGTSHPLIHLCGKRLTKMVAIGKGLDQPTLKAQCEVCVVAP